MVSQLKDIVEAWGLTFQNLSSMTPLVLPAKNIVRAFRFEIIVDDKISELPRLIMEPRIRYFEQSKRRFRKVFDVIIYRVINQTFSTRKREIQRLHRHHVLITF